MFLIFFLPSLLYRDFISLAKKIRDFISSSSLFSSNLLLFISINEKQRYQSPMVRFNVILFRLFYSSVFRFVFVCFQICENGTVITKSWWCDELVVGERARRRRHGWGHDWSLHLWPTSWWSQREVGFCSLIVLCIALSSWFEGL